MKLSATNVVLAAICLSSAAVASPVAQEETKGYGGVVPPCATIRCANGPPYYERKTRRCLCPPINCPLITLCLEGYDAYYDWKRRDCSCRPFPTVN